jgi:hypothetical protein
MMKASKRSLALVVIFVAAQAVAVYSQAPSQKSKLGLVFNAKNLLSLNGYEDCYQAGAGFKYWILPAFAARGLVGIEHNTNSAGDASTTTLGLGLAGEYHPVQKDVSPYVGGLLGLRSLFVTDQTTAVDLYFGGLAGVEFKVLGPVSAFAEYDLVATLDSNGFSINLGTDGSGGPAATIGLIVYF